MSETLPEPHNTDHGHQGSFCRGLLDFVLLRYAIDACGGVDTLALTHLDELDRLPREVCDAYLIDNSRIETLSADNVSRIEEAQPVLSELPRDPSGFVAAVTQSLSTPVGFVSSGPTYADKQPHGS